MEMIPDIAIVGMSCAFPGASDLEQYWQNILEGVDAISEPPEGWGDEFVYDAGSLANDRVYTRLGGFLKNETRFNPLDYGVMPSSIDGAEPDHFLALKLAHDALDHAGYADKGFNRERTEVILGRGEYFNRGNVTALQHGLIVEQTLRVLKTLHPEHTEDELQAIKAGLKASLPPFNAETAPGLVPNVVCGRIANRLDFMGANYTIDAACASSLIAIKQGMLDLMTNQCDVALVGGVHATTPPIVFMVFCQLQALSKTGRIRPYDQSADGTILGEGLGMLVLKRRDDAERDGDTIYALIRGVGTSSDGRALGLLAPRVEGEMLALRRAYSMAKIDPKTVGLIEGHGTGTPVGDASEIEALREVFGEREGLFPDCALGSVKSMIGHTMPAAGIAGTIKAIMALHHKTIPPSLHCEEPHELLEEGRSPLYISRETRPWIHGGAAPRRAGVSAFGFGGINGHVVLEEYAGGAA